MKCCVVCGKEVETVNRRGMCDLCAYNQIKESIRQMRGKYGPYYELWKTNVGLAREVRRIQQRRGK